MLAIESSIHISGVSTTKVLDRVVYVDIHPATAGQEKNENTWYRVLAHYDAKKHKQNIQSRTILKEF